MRYTGIQPQYFPRLHYFARILNTDLFMIRDDVQFVARHKYPDGHNGPSYQAHSPIKDPSGENFLLTVTVRHNGRNTIRDTEISYDEEWRLAHLKTLKLYYAKSPNLQKILPEIEAILSIRYKYLAELTIATMLWGLLHLLGEKHVSPEMLDLSQVVKKLKNQNSFRLRNMRLGTESEALKDPSLDKSEKIIAVCREIGANEDYCGGTARAAYMDDDFFKNNGIKLVEQDWKCQEYPQQFMKHGFLPNLSILDLLFNASYEQAVTVIKG